MPEAPRSWTFLSNHAHVLVCLAADPDSRLRDIAAEVGITERRVNGILADLEGAGIVTVFKSGRRNSYKIDRRARLRHPLESHKTVGDLLKGVL
ncbi:MAG: winged helix-turn-helix domain-containing protein [Actinomycetota bacterium]|nr:winged helix-turn-helix domain-containing protein [Actinomycetota bacterium]MDA2972788.1 winged helix-turn-helix domain-containing protein [Actinomycetota bacterium]MDA3002259.1 winged helix-turn-helix domain-containing protein [Actinomycetota bacterium]